jgi:hypothetical protein
MAEALATPSIPNALTIVLTGNVHACKGTLPGVPSYPLMASFLPPAVTVSLLVIDRGGEAWNCQEGICGPHRLTPRKGNERRITLSPPHHRFLAMTAYCQPASSLLRHLRLLPKSEPPRGLCRVPPLCLTIVSRAFF